MLSLTKKILGNKIILLAIGGSIVFLALGGGIAALTIKKNPQFLGLSKGAADIQKETDDLVALVGKLIALPKDEKPTVATITDIDKLKDQPFFKNAKNGDSVLIYTNAKKAILYRKSENKIVEVGAVNIQNQVAGTQSAKFMILNGTKTSGLTKLLEDDLKKVLTTAEVTDRANAVRSDYQQSLIIDLTGKQSEGVQQLAKALNLKVSNLPDGEKKPDNVDFLIIIGQDRIAQPTSTPTPTPTP